MIQSIQKPSKSTLLSPHAKIAQIPSLIFDFSNLKKKKLMNILVLWAGATDVVSED